MNPLQLLIPSMLVYGTASTHGSITRKTSPSCQVNRDYFIDFQPKYGLCKKKTASLLHQKTFDTCPPNIQVLEHTLKEGGIKSCINTISKIFDPLKDHRQLTGLACPSNASTCSWTCPDDPLIYQVDISSCHGFGYNTPCPPTFETVFPLDPSVIGNENFKHCTGTFINFTTLQPSPPPSSVPSARPTGLPSLVPSSEPSVRPTGLPFLVPSFEPSVRPTGLPFIVPSSEPSVRPTARLSPRPTIPQSIVSLERLFESLKTECIHSSEQENKIVVPDGTTCHVRQSKKNGNILCTWINEEGINNTQAIYRQDIDRWYIKDANDTIIEKLNKKTGVCKEIEGKKTTSIDVLRILKTTQNIEYVITNTTENNRRKLETSSSLSNVIGFKEPETQTNNDLFLWMLAPSILNFILLVKGFFQKLNQDQGSGQAPQHRTLPNMLGGMLLGSFSMSDELLISVLFPEKMNAPLDQRLTFCVYPLLRIVNPPILGSIKTSSFFPIVSEAINRYDKFSDLSKKSLWCTLDITYSLAVTAGLGIDEFYTVLLSSFFFNVPFLSAIRSVLGEGLVQSSSDRAGGEGSRDGTASLRTGDGSDEESGHATTIGRGNDTASLRTRDGSDEESGHATTTGRIDGSSSAE